MASKQGPATIVHLSQPVMDGQREVSKLYLAGKPGGIAIPATLKGEELEVDALAVEQSIAARAGLSVGAVRKLAPVDLMTVFFALFGGVHEPVAAKARQPSAKR